MRFRVAVSSQADYNTWEKHLADPVEGICHSNGSQHFQLDRRHVLPFELAHVNPQPQSDLEASPMSATVQQRLTDMWESPHTVRGCGRVYFL